jgi:hypothetical protein
MLLAVLCHYSSSIKQQQPCPGGSEASQTNTAQLSMSSILQRELVCPHASCVMHVVNLYSAWQTGRHPSVPKSQQMDTMGAQQHSHDGADSRCGQATAWLAAVDCLHIKAGASVCVRGGGGAEGNVTR